MPNIVKLECQSCGAPLDVIIGTNHIICKFCGSSYMVTNSEEEHSEDNSALGFSKNNPAETKLVKVDINTCDLNLKERKNVVYPSTDYISPELLLGYRERDISAFKAELRIKLLLFAALSYASGENYELLIGSSISDFHAMRLTNKLFRPKPEAAYALLYPDRYRSYEPKFVYTFSNRLRERISNAEQGVEKFDCLSNKEGAYDIKYRIRAHNKKILKKLSSSIDEVISEFHLSYNDVERRHTIIRLEPVRKLFGGTKNQDVIWVIKFSERKLFLDMSPNVAYEYLENKTDTLEKIIKNDFIVGASGRIHQLLMKWERVQLSEKSTMPIKMVVSESFAGIVTTDTSIIERYAESHTEAVEDQLICYYSEFGMKDVNNDNLKVFILACILSSVNKLAQVDGSLKWGFSACYADGIWSMVCSAKTEGVYNDWM